MTRLWLPRTMICCAFVFVGLAAGGAAVAYWATSGAGNGTARSGVSPVIDLTAGTAVGDLFPGGTATVSTIAANPAPSSGRIGSLALNTAQGMGGFTISGAPNCAGSAFSFTTQTNNGAGWTVPGNSTLTIALSSAISLSSTAANACQGATVTVHLIAGS